MNPNIEPTNQGHRILVLVLTILLTAGAVGGGVYYVLNQQNEKQNKLIEELQKENDTKTTVAKNETADLKTYKNDKYKFQVTIPVSWEGYKVEEREKQENVEVIYDFKLYSEELKGYHAPIGIAVFTKEKYETEQVAALQSGMDGYEKDIIKTGSDYVYVAFYPQDEPGDMREKSKKTTEIIASFELTK